MPDMKAFHRRKKMVEYRLLLPRQTIDRLALVRACTGIPKAEWMRAQIMLACDMELCRRPGAFWLRPGARIYKMNVDLASDVPMVPVPVTVAQGGERVWIMEILPNLSVGSGDKGLEPAFREGSILCDITANEDGQVNLRRVWIASADVVPMDVAYNTGLGAIKVRQERERRRRAAQAEITKQDANPG